MEKLPAVEEKNINKGCSNCSNVTQILDLRKVLATGFGDVTVMRDGHLMYSEQCFESGEFPTAQFYEDKAKKHPDHDWRIHFFAPLHEETYQRQGDKNWVMISSGPGFA